MITEIQDPPVEDASESDVVVVCSLCGAEDLKSNMAPFWVQGFEPCDHYIEYACVVCQDHEQAL